MRAGMEWAGACIVWVDGESLLLELRDLVAANIHLVGVASLLCISHLHFYVKAAQHTGEGGLGCKPSSKVGPCRGVSIPCPCSHFPLTLFFPPHTMAHTLRSPAAVTGSTGTSETERKGGRGAHIFASVGSRIDPIMPLKYVLSEEPSCSFETGTLLRSALYASISCSLYGWALWFATVSWCWLCALYSSEFRDLYAGPVMI